MLETRAWTTYVAAMKRGGEPMSNNDFSLPQDVLVPDERVVDATFGTTSSEDDPVLIATDRRVLLARKRAFGRWHVVKESPGSQVVGAQWRSTLLAGRLSVELRDGRTIDLRTRDEGRAQRMVASIRGMLGA